MVNSIHFGTDGWRDIIGAGFHYANLAQVSQAYAHYLQGSDSQRVVVGYDTRFNGRLFATRVAEVLAANGLDVLLACDYLPTPALSFAVKHYSAAGGVMLTASHNPPSYSGFKLKGAYGGTATSDIYDAVSAQLETTSPDAVASFDPEKHSYQSFDIREAYYQALGQLVDLERLRAFPATLVHDAMGGAAAGWLRGFIEYSALPITLEELRSAADPMFYGVNPEPIPQNIQPSIAHMRQSQALFATVTDGDGDRLGVVLPGGTFFNSHQIFAVLLEHLSSKGLHGQVVKTFSTSRIIERLAAERELPLLETPVGFKYIVDAMLAGDVLIGGEESGGIGVYGHIPERDGIANSLLLLEAIASSGQTLADSFAALEAATNWQHAYDRLDLQLSDNRLKDAVMRHLEIASFAGYPVSSIERLDGIKLNLGEEAWLLVRPSGTEPVLRLYCEAPNDSRVQSILQAAHTLVQSLA